MVASLPTSLARAVDLLKQRSARATVLVEEGDLTICCPSCGWVSWTCSSGGWSPGYAAPDLETEALYNEPMVAVVRPGCAAEKHAPVGPTWPPCPVLPPPWASLRACWSRSSTNTACTRRRISSKRRPFGAGHLRP